MELIREYKCYRPISVYFTQWEVENLWESQAKPTVNAKEKLLWI